MIEITASQEMGQEKEMNKDKKWVLTGWVRILFGLLVFAFGVHLTI